MQGNKNLRDNNRVIRILNHSEPPKRNAGNSYSPNSSQMHPSLMKDNSFNPNATGKIGIPSKGQQNELANPLSNILQSSENMPKNNPYINLGSNHNHNLNSNLKQQFADSQGNQVAGLNNQNSNKSPLNQQQNKINHQQPAASQANPQQHPSQQQSLPPQAPQQQVQDFKMEIERRFERSMVNKTFKMPKKNNENENDSIESTTSSIESMRGVTLYNLKNQSLKRQIQSIQTKKKSSGASNSNFGNNNNNNNNNNNGSFYNEDDRDQGGAGRVMKTEGDQANYPNYNPYNQFNTSISQSAQQTFSEHVNANPNGFQKTFYQPNVNSNVAPNINSLGARINPKLVSRPGKQEFQGNVYMPTEPSHSNGQLQLSQTNTMFHTSSMNKSLLGGQNTKGSQNMGVKTNYPIMMMNSQQGIGGVTGLRLATEGSEPMNPKENGSGINKALFYYQKAQGDIYQRFRPQSNTKIKPVETNNYVENNSVSQDQKAMNLSVSKSFHFKSNSKQNYNEFMDKSSTLQSIEQNTIGFDDIYNQDSMNKKTVKQINGMSSDRNEKKEFIDIQSYINSQMKQKTVKKM